MEIYGTGGSYKGIRCQIVGTSRECSCPGASCTDTNGLGTSFLFTYGIGDSILAGITASPTSGTNNPTLGEAWEIQYNGCGQINVPCSSNNECCSDLCTSGLCL